MTEWLDLGLLLAGGSLGFVLGILAAASWMSFELRCAKQEIQHAKISFLGAVCRLEDLRREQEVRVAHAQALVDGLVVPSMPES